MKKNENRFEGTAIPELYKIKSIHYELMRAYVESLATVSRLPLFVGMNEIRINKNVGFKHFILKLLWGKYSPLRLLVWRPVVSLFVEAHIHKKMRELITGYRQFKFVVFENYPINKDLLMWLDKAEGECRQLLETITSGKIFLDATKFVFSLFLNILIVAWGANSLFDLTISITSLKPPVQGTEFVGNLIILMFSAVLVLLMFVDATFATKRFIFSSINTNKKDVLNLYKLENELFTNLNRGKAKEAPIDLFVTAFYYLIYTITIWLLGSASQITIQAQGSSEITRIHFTWCLIVPMIILWVKDIILPWQKREREEEL